MSDSSNEGPFLNVMIEDLYVVNDGEYGEERTVLNTTIPTRFPTGSEHSAAKYSKTTISMSKDIFTQR